jgi:hypothetical protein
MKWTSLSVWLLAAIAVPCVALPQAVTESAADRERQIIAAIGQEQSRNGPLAEQLIAPWSALALHYQESGDRALAAAAIHRILQLVRVNYGLHSLEQAPVIERLIANEAAIGNAETALELDQELLSLARRHPTDLRTVSIFPRAGGHAHEALVDGRAHGASGVQHGAGPSLSRSSDRAGRPRRHARADWSRLFRPGLHRSL